jgi:hypothetical protein
MQDVRNYEIVQDDVKYPTKALDEAAKLLKEQGTNSIAYHSNGVWRR